MVEINGTLIIQALNFLIAYILLRVFLFKPGIALIEQAAAYYSGLLSGIESRKAAIAVKELEQEQQWRNFQERARETIPAQELPEQLRDEHFPAIERSMFPDSTVQELVRESTQSFVEKVNHARW